MVLSVIKVFMSNKVITQIKKVITQINKVITQNIFL